MLTDPDTTVGTAPLAEVAWMEDLPDLIAMRYTAAERWTSVRSGSSTTRCHPNRTSASTSRSGQVRRRLRDLADPFGSWGFSTWCARE
ncbi:hypothetical protein G7085_11850 [Tessaracoccus sp. HDW20]|uniref:hypothetical protein n=1 Tax=Tessaracoccus coleopterorum TaxID=2714950 RepID=UPI0018D32FCF|nr:hypothetical protein [Tessaracoccus coleopterorum]NHB85075.1 hypothetical protein [Tessaracoccus coleopterorum]